MKTTQSLKVARRLLGVAMGVAALLSPMVAGAADDRTVMQESAPAQLAMLDSASYRPSSESRDTTMTARWEAIQRAVRPDVLVRLTDAFARDFPDSAYDEADKNLQFGARKALAAVRSARLSADALEDGSGNVGYRGELVRALRGDKDAAYRVAQMYRSGSNGVIANARRGEQWLHVAAELGNGDASWQVAQIYNRAGLVGEAARFEAKAVEAGYALPARLPTKGRNI